MLPTPSTSHVPFDRVYEPAEDSYLLLDTLSSELERGFLKNRFDLHHSPSPLIVEIGTGSGVVLSFLNAHAEIILGRADVLTLGIDLNIFACRATESTVALASQEQVTQHLSHGCYAGNVRGDLTDSLKAGTVDILIFNPPYVPTSELPCMPTEDGAMDTPRSFENDSRLLSLSYAGGQDGMEVTSRLLASLPRVMNRETGCAYILLCAQNKPEEVKESVKRWGAEWLVETVGSSGKRAGWEKLQIIRIWRKGL